MQTKTEKEKLIDQPNWFIRILVIVILIVIVVIIFFPHIIPNFEFEITNQVIVLLGLAIVLVLSETFSDLRLGQFLTLSKRHEEVKKEKEEVIADNYKLREGLLNVITNISNNNRNENKTILNQLIGVEQQTNDHNNDEFAEVENNHVENFEAEEIIEEIINEELKEDEAPFNNMDDGRYIEVDEKINNRRAYSYRNENYIIELMLLNKLADKLSININKIIRNAKFTDEFSRLDPISASRNVYDGYFIDNGVEYFVEVSTPNQKFFKDKIINYLWQIQRYKKFVKHEVILFLIIGNFVDKQEKIGLGSSYIYNIFQPALKNDLLRIYEFDISENEVNEWKEIIKTTNIKSIS